MYDKDEIETPAELALEKYLEAIPEEVDPNAVILCEDGCTVHDDGSGDYATYEEAEKVDAAANLNEDDELPPYSIYARYWAAPDKKEDRKPLKYPRLTCGHKLRGEGFEPNHRNCEKCWFTFFQINGQFSQAVEEAYQTGGGDLIKKLRGSKFLDMWLKFMSTVALIKRQQEEAIKAKEKEVGTSLDSSRTEHYA